MISWLSLCSLPGGVPACDGCLRNHIGKILPRADEPQSWVYPRKGVGTCLDELSEKGNSDA